MSTNTTQQRISFSTVKNRVPYPDLLKVQLKSFRDFFQMDTTAENRKNEGLYKVFQENFPITDTRNNFVLEFIDYYVDPPRYSIEECLERGLTYSVPLKAKLKLYCTDTEHEDFGVVVQDVYFGTIPYMTERGTFVINGAERVIVSQLHRSPGVFFGQSMHTNGTKLYSARIIPFKGSWIEFATDINNVMYAYIDRKKKLPVTTLLRAIGFEADQQILEIFDLADEVKVTKANLKKAVGRMLAARVLSTWVEDFVDEDTGEVVSIERNNVIVDRETVLQEEHIEQIIESGAKTILLHKENPSGIDFSIIYNTLQKDPCNSEKEAVVYIYRQLRASEPPDEATARDVIEKLFFSDKRYDLGDVGRFRINKKLGLEIDPEIRTLTREDIIAIIKYLIQLINSQRRGGRHRPLVEPPCAHRRRAAVESVLGGLRAYGAYDPRAHERARQRGLHARRPDQRQDAVERSSTRSSAPASCRSSWTRSIRWPKLRTNAVCRRSVPAVCRATAPVSRCATCTTRITAVSVRSSRRKVPTSV